MVKLQRFTPILIVLLTLVGRPGVSPVPELSGTAHIAAQTGEAPRDTLSASPPHSSPAYLGSEIVSLKLLADRSGSAGRQLIGPARLDGHGAPDPHGLASMASRIRALQRSHLDVAGVLAAARTGERSSRSTTIPPPHQR